MGWFTRKTEDKSQQLTSTEKALLAKLEAIPQGDWRYSDCSPWWEIWTDRPDGTRVSVVLTDEDAGDGYFRGYSLEVRIKREAVWHGTTVGPFYEFYKRHSERLRAAKKAKEQVEQQERSARWAAEQREKEARARDLIDRL